MIFNYHFKADIKKCKQPPEHTYLAQWNAFCAALYKTKKEKKPQHILPQINQ